MLKQLLAGQSQLFEGQKQLVEGQKQILVRLDRVEGRLDKLEGRMDLVEGRLDKMEGRLDKIEGRLDKIEGRLEIVEGRVGHNSEVAQALLHRTEELNAQVHSSGHNLAELTGAVNQIRDRMDSLERKATRIDANVYSMAGDVSFLLRKTSEHDEVIRHLNRAK